MSEDVPFHDYNPGPSHYYGDVVRILFVIAAVLILVSQFIGSPFLAPLAALVLAVVLVISAGLTNPVMASIQWANAFLSIIGVLLFGTIAYVRYHEGGAASSDVMLLFLLVLDFVLALYYGIRTLRGVLMRDAPVIE